MTRLDEELAWAFDARYRFTRRPSPVDGEFRPGWRISVLLLMLARCSRGGRSSFPRLHLLNWGLRSHGARETLIAAVEGRTSPDAVLIRYEPSFHRAITLAAGLALVELRGGKRVQLSDKGRAAAEAIREDDGVLEAEKRFLDRLGYRLTEKLVKDIVWRS